MKKFAIAALAVLSVSACAQSVPSSPAPVSPISSAVGGPAAAPPPAPQPEPPPAFPVTINGPDGKPLAVIRADGSISGDRAKLLELLDKQKGGAPQDNILIALLMRAMVEDGAKAIPSPVMLPGPARAKH